MNKFKIATAVLAVAFIHDTVVSHRNRKKFEAMKENNHNLFIIADGLNKQVEYLTHVMNEHEVPVTEFDRIIMSNLLP
jgi:hypothetical protein